VLQRLLLAGTSLPAQQIMIATVLKHIKRQDSWSPLHTPASLSKNIHAMPMAQ
jgi:hypothetical protein